MAIKLEEGKIYLDKYGKKYKAFPPEIGEHWTLAPYDHKGLPWLLYEDGSYLAREYVLTEEVSESGNT